MTIGAEANCYFWVVVVVVVLDLLLLPPHAARHTAAPTATAPATAIMPALGVQSAAVTVPASLPEDAGPSSDDCTGALGVVVPSGGVVVVVPSGVVVDPASSEDCTGAGVPPDTELPSSCAKAQVENTMARLAVIAIHLRDMKRSSPGPSDLYKHDAQIVKLPLRHTP